jgi:hypothetical protein
MKENHRQEFKSVAETGWLVVQGFDDHGNALAATDTRSGKAVPQMIAAQFVQNCDDQACAGGSQGMAERDGPAVDIRLIAIKSQHFLHGKILRGKSFVDFHTIHLLKRQARKFQSLL